MRRIFFPCVLLSFLLLPGQALAQTKIPHGLDEVSGFGILTESTPQECEEVEITRSVLQGKAEMSLRTSGIGVSKSGFRSHLYVRIHCLKVDEYETAYALIVEFMRPAFIVRDGFRQLRDFVRPSDFVGPDSPIPQYNAWSEAMIGVSGKKQLKSNVLGHLDGILTRFADDFLKANPKK